MRREMATKPRPGPRWRRQSRTVFETQSTFSGRIRVIEDQVERRLVVAGDTLSVYPLDRDWVRVRKEYWWQALAAVTFPPRPSVLLVGLGGGTQIHILRRLVPPRQISPIQRGPVIIQGGPGLVSPVRPRGPRVPLHETR